LFLVDPVTGRQANASTSVQQRLGLVHGTVEREPPGGSRDGGGLLGSGTHPSANEGEAEITDQERYEHIRELLGDAIATPVAGLHIHVGMPDAETAIRVFNGLRRHLPLLQALGANSPFRHGRDTGLASAREVTMRGWPRSGVPRDA
jgi:carboxylate-amine ligase